MTKTVVALYDDLTAAQNAVQDLVNAGISRDHISLVAQDTAGNYGKYVTRTGESVDDAVTAGEGASFGAVVGALTGALVGLGALAIPGIGPVLAAGPLLAALGGGAVGLAAGAITGGIVGGLVKTGVPEEEAQYYAEGVRRGGTLVTVTADDAMETRVEAILNRYFPVDLQRRATYWKESGWKGFDEKSKPYGNEDVTKDRTGYGTYAGKSSTASTGGARTYSGTNTRVS